MRPKSIVRFEQAYLGSIIVWAIGLATGWGSRTQMIETNPAFAGNPQMLGLAQTVMIGFSLFMLALWLLLWYFTARKASEVTKWIIVAFFALSVVGLPFALMAYERAGLLATGLTLLMFALNAYAVWMLFQPDARTWFNGGDTAEHTIADSDAPPLP
ncbi:hypothetical protein ABS767_12390 [Sphingomonas sp. ST-64]|uniref:Uncharacterized protein n=1 Tax=Sphingomonas plantiphila TaxID=3163295 RepID=A0ABW8YNA4_9SPHN